MNQTQFFKTTAVTGSSTAIAAVLARKFIVGSINDQGEFSFSTHPVMHDTAESADQEAKRLAQLKHGTAFIVARLCAGKLVPKVLGVAEF